MQVNYTMTIKILIFVAIALSSGCANNRKHPAPVKTDKEMMELKDPMVNVNRFLVEKDQIIIEKYVARSGLAMTKTETGLWYLITEQGSGNQVHEDSRVSLNYLITLLDGTFCYSTDSLGPESFIVGKSRMETGLDEGIRLLRQGDKARFIMAPHLAHGLLGDDDKIPPRAILIFDIEVLLVD